MKPVNWILYFSAISFLAILPLIWIVAGLAADLKQMHPVAGWAVWVGAGVALLILCVPVIRFLRLPSLPPRQAWQGQSAEMNEAAWKDTALLLLKTSDDPESAADLRRVMKDTPSGLPDRVGDELARRRGKAAVLRSSMMRQAALLSLLSPHRHMDFLILLWLNLKQVFLVGQCYGFKPSPRGLLKLYAGVFGSAMLIDAIDEVAEQSLTEGVSKLAGDIPLLREATSFAYEAIRSAAYVGLIGMLTEYLLQNELNKPAKDERKVLRSKTWEEAMRMVGGLRLNLGKSEGEPSSDS